MTKNSEDKELKNLHKLWKKAERKEAFKLNLQIFGLALLYSLVAISLYLFFKEIIPGFNFVFYKDEAGEIQDIRLGLSAIIAFPVTMLLISGYTAWKKNWHDNEDIIIKLEKKFNLVDKLNKEINESKDSLDSYENEKIVKSIKKIIDRSN